jgi:hypothetical protein
VAVICTSCLELRTSDELGVCRTCGARTCGQGVCTGRCECDDDYPEFLPVVVEHQTRKVAFLKDRYY